MPVHSCTSDGKPGFQWGSKGKCYTYTPGNEESRKRARTKAERQGRAAHASGYRGSEPSGGRDSEPRTEAPGSEVLNDYSIASQKTNLENTLSILKDISMLLDDLSKVV